MKLLITIVILLAFATGILFAIWDTQDEISPQDQIIINQTIQETQNTTRPQNPNADQYPEINEPHWGHMPVTYQFKSDCIPRLEDLMKKGFDSIQTETAQVVQFEEVAQNPDIEIYCLEKEGAYIGETTLANAQTKRDGKNPNLIKSARINVFNQGMVCSTGYPALEVHEILHSFGFEHSPLLKSVMSRYSSESSKSCDITKIDQPYITCMQYIYTNGSTSDDCAEVKKNTITIAQKDQAEIEYSCQEGWYKSTDESYCCPEPGMRVEDGFCVEN
ncbi:MAG: hypothetical protein ACI83O_000343 [Patescibacteria group bacterium]|jgi:hypothetical protein